MKILTMILAVVMLLGTIVPAHAVTGGGTFKQYTFDDTPPSASDDSSDSTIGEQNALRVGREYLDAMGFSYQGLIEQLEYEGFSHEEAVYACNILFGYNELLLKKGSKGDIVRKVQQQLFDLGYLSGSIDGIFGSGTERAVKSFQVNRGIEATGIVDEATYEALFDESSTENSYTFTGAVTLAMEMDVDTLWSSSSSAAFGAVVILADIFSEEIPGIDISGIQNVCLAQISIKDEGPILAYYYFHEADFICAIFNPETGEITVTAIPTTESVKHTMNAMCEANILKDYQNIDMDDISEILNDLMSQL